MIFQIDAGSMCISGTKVSCWLAACATAARCCSLSSGKLPEAWHRILGSTKGLLDFKYDFGIRIPGKPAGEIRCGTLWVNNLMGWGLTFSRIDDKNHPHLRFLRAWSKGYRGKNKASGLCGLSSRSFFIWRFLRNVQTCPMEATCTNLALRCSLLFFLRLPMAPRSAQHLEILFLWEPVRKNAPDFYPDTLWFHQTWLAGKSPPKMEALWLYGEDQWFLWSIFQHAMFDYQMVPSFSWCLTPTDQHSPFDAESLSM